MGRQRPAEPPLRQAEPVVRCRVEVPDAGLPGRVDGRLRVLVADRDVEIADRRAAEAEFGYLDAGAADPPAVHAPAPLSRVSPYQRTAVPMSCASTRGGRSARSVVMEHLLH